MFPTRLLPLLLLLPCSLLRGQLPSEALLIINGRSLEATQIANEYARARNFPSERILVLTPPVSFFRKPDGTPLWTVPLADARIHLLEPVLEKVEALQDASPTALILSPEWPTRVAVPESPHISTTALLGCRGNIPKAELIKNGRAISPWFSPPPDTPQRSVRMHRYPVKRPVDPLFHPAAMLGVYVEPMTTEKIAQGLRESVGADFRQPVGSIVFETNADVRTKTRLQQYQMAASRLRDKDVEVAFVHAGEKLPGDIIGVMGGAATLETSRYQKKIVSGAFADHLTSFAATFDNTIQTKLTRWLDAGAAASAGTVTEPYAIWTKFPEAALFERYLKGNTLLEALMQSLASPYQTLIVGDPLCRPWGADLEDLKVGTRWEEHTLRVEITGVPESSLTQHHLFMDGQRVPGNGPVWNLPRDPENTGPEMELIVHSRYQWAPPRVGSIRRIEKTPFENSLVLKGSVKADHLALTLKSEEPLMWVEIYRGLDHIHTSTAKGARPVIQLGLTESGTGPVRLRAKAVTAGGQVRWSTYLDVNPEPPR